MLSYFFDFAGHDLVDFIAVRNDLLHLEAAIEKFLFEFFGRYVYIYIFFKPT